MRTRGSTALRGRQFFLKEPAEFEIIGACERALGAYAPVIFAEQEQYRIRATPPRSVPAQLMRQCCAGPRGVSTPAWTENAYHQHRSTNNGGVQAFLSRRKPAPLCRETRILTQEPKFYYRDKGKDKGPMIPMKIRPSSKAEKWRGRTEIKGSTSKTGSDIRYLKFSVGKRRHRIHRSQALCLLREEQHGCICP